MGQDVPKTEFTAAEHAAFAARLQQDLDALAALLARPGFGQGATTIGAELEMALIDPSGRPLPAGDELVGDDSPEALTHELARFNLELNVPPVALAGRPFTALAAKLDATLAETRRLAATRGGDVATVGILPTLRESDLTSRAISQVRRYHALAAGLRRLKSEPVRCQIDGDEPLTASFDSIALEGANTSFQLHLRTAPAEFAATMNAAQLVVAPALAVAGNAPLFLGHRLWEETRVALFWQSFDDRPDLEQDDWRPRRVSFGHGWVRQGALELFAESVALHAPLLPVLGDEGDPVALVRRGGVPGLAELRLHSGTVWRWNRPVFDPGDGGHLRIELRALPSGPTVADMMANAAFLLGLTLAARRDVEARLPGLTFEQAQRNFYAAARRGLDAELLWPDRAAPSPRPVSAARLALDLLPLARDGLTAAGVDGSEADAHLALIEHRVALRQTGAQWQRLCLAEMSRHQTRDDAVQSMLVRYQELSRSGRPVATWPLRG